MEKSSGLNSVLTSQDQFSRNCATAKRSGVQIKGFDIFSPRGFKCPCKVVFVNSGKRRAIEKHRNKSNRSDERQLIRGESYRSFKIGCEKYLVSLIVFSYSFRKIGTIGILLCHFINLMCRTKLVFCQCGINQVEIESEFV